jgi:hypothetical protein
MASLTIQKLFGPDGSARIRDNRVAIDAIGWTPDNVVNDAGAPDSVLLDAHEWETVRLVARFNGSVNGTETVDVTPLIAVPDPEAPTSRLWSAMPTVTLAPQLDNDEVVVQGHKAGFRIDVLTLGTATSVDIIVTGGQFRRRSEP